MKNTPLLLLISLLFFYCQPTEIGPTDFQTMIAEQGSGFDIWIKGGTLYDGASTDAQKADVLVRGSEILFVGTVDTAAFTATTIIDASGKVVAPGFIDTHAHGDPLEAPEFHNFLSMGVTSICFGQDGTSPSYRDPGDWMTQVDSLKTGVNIALFVGHGTLRLLSGTGFEADPTRVQRDSMEALLAKAMEAGCFGMTTGLEYTPGLYAENMELLDLAKVVGEYEGMIMSHMRNEDDDAMEASLKELLQQGQWCNVHVSHIKSVFGKGGERAEELLAIMEKAREKNSYAVTGDIYPYTASYTGISIIFPTWARPPNNYERIKQERREELLTFLRDKVISRNGPSATLFGTGAYTGKTLEEVSQEQGRSFEEVLLDLGPAGASAAYFVMDESLQVRFMQDPHIMICSDGSPTMHHPRGYGSFARIIETFVLEQESFSLGEAIHKMTGLPATTIGLTDRGFLKAGQKGDIIIFDPEMVKANADFSHPNLLSEGFEEVLVNGQRAITNGQISGERFGEVLRKSGR